MYKKVSDFNKKFKLKQNPNIRMHDISSEAGEMAKEVIKCQDYGRKKFELSEALEMEVGDLIYSLLSFAQENGIDPEVALDRVLVKYQKRFSSWGNIGSGK